MRDLITRLEAALEGSRDLDQAIEVQPDIFDLHADDLAGCLCDGDL